MLRDQEFVSDFLFRLVGDGVEDTQVVLVLRAHRLHLSAATIAAIYKQR